MPELSLSTDPIGETTRRQRVASDPKSFAWVSANAGSGKTHVLTQRVIRLLLTGVRPSSILCLTYTKAAAAEMSNRVFKTLSGWTLLDDEKLAREIEKMEGALPQRAKLAEARRLFAKALETPGGLKIQTIHAFCEALLHQFPLEANVAGHFSVLDDRGSANLLADVKRNLLVAATAEDDVDLASAFATVMDFGSDSGLETLIADALAQRSGIRDFERSAALSGGRELALRKFLSLEPDDSKHAVLQQFMPLSGFSEAEAKDYIAFAMAKGGSKVQETAAKLAAAFKETDPATQAAALTDVFLKKDGEPRANGSFFNKAMVTQDPALEASVVEAIEHIKRLQTKLKALELLEATLAALFIANRLNGDYEDLKKRMGHLDFEDLIERAAELLTKSEAGPWIHYKLDQGIDHILVDEAQDTSPVQWRIIQALSAEFFAGKTARDTHRTMFAVGDEKQSIYSFQGARPEKFSGEGRHVKALAEGAGLDFKPISLPLSFRSTSHVLSAVDQVFAFPENRKGLSAAGEDIIHASSRSGHPGQTSIWEVIAPTEADDEDDWTLPFDATPESAPPAILARRIADTIADWLGKETVVEDGKSRLMQPGDILVLVRKRDGFATALTRALKSRNNIPVGGADRLVLTRHIAVQDLMALGRFILLPEDDLSLAALCKSPLINLTEEDLMLAAAGRGKSVSLWQRFTSLAKEDNSDFVNAHKTISQWLAISAGLSPFSFFARILGPLGGRQKFLARLGSEAGDVLDEFLSVALDHEQNNLPGLQAFISALELEPPTVKREQDKDRNEVRIMTVHASKGLEAPVVFLIDDCSAAFNANHMPKVRLLERQEPLGPVPLWLPGADMNIALTDADKERRRALAEEEYRRLLYVGMTRAADRLIVCGHRKKREAAECWHKMVWAALLADEARCRETTFKTRSDEWAGLVWVSGEPEREISPGKENTKLDSDLSLPESLFKPLPPVVRLPRPLSPSGAAIALDDDIETVPTRSRLFGDKTSKGDGAYRGRIIHRLFQVLPDISESDRRDAAKRYLERAVPYWTDAQRQHVRDQVFAVLSDPALASLFSADAKAEASVMGILTLAGKDCAISGRIDRMTVERERVVIADFKTDRRPPETLDDISESYLTQLAIYRAILAPLYPGKEIDCVLIYTGSAQAFTIPHERLEGSLSRLA